LGAFGGNIIDFPAVGETFTANPQTGKAEVIG
jgi:hypothetical protein